MTVLTVSKSPVGSSSKRMSGSLAIDRAMVTRCCSPPAHGVAAVRIVHPSHPS
jgi:hypothetical protein